MTLNMKRKMLTKTLNPWVMRISKSIGVIKTKKDFQKKYTSDPTTVPIKIVEDAMFALTDQLEYLIISERCVNI